MIRFITKKLGYGLLVLMGVVVVVFFLFQGFGDPARLVLGQSGDSTTISNIKKELALDQPTSKQFLLYLNDVSPIGIYSASDIESKKLKYINHVKSSHDVVCYLMILMNLILFCSYLV
jgi:peptide/nickel transport system permease protein